MAEKYSLKIDNLSYAYPSEKKFALDNINLKFLPGHIYSILGKNGCGKSTLLKCLNSYINNYHGSICINTDNNKIDIKALTSKDRAKQISYIPQNNALGYLNVYDTIMLGRYPYINFNPSLHDHEIVDSAINKFELNNISMKNINELSGGEFQRVCIARLFAQESNIILLDEPTNNLDIHYQHETFDILKKEVQQKNLIAICVIHDINFALRYADELIFLNDGNIIKKGNKEILSEELMHDIYDVDAKIVSLDGNKIVII